MITIIMATYNSEKYISEFFKSMKFQDLENIELIIIDSCSNDKTLKIIKDNRSLVSNLIVEKDNSVYEAWNKGLDVCNGDWICFIGSDDILETDCLNIIKNSTSNVSNDVNLIVFNSIFINEDSKSKRKFESSFDKEIFKNKFSFSHPMSLHKKTLFDKSRFSSDYGSSGDYYFLLSEINSLNVLLKNDYVVRIREAGISQNIESLKNTYKVRKKLRSVGRYKNIYNLVRAYLSWKYHQITQR